MSGYLTLADGSHRPLHNGFLLGRVVGCDLVIDDTKASRKHARLIVDNGVVEIEDLASSNGTLLNDKPVTRRVLRDGDRVQIGKSVLVFREGAAPGTRAAAPAASPFAAEDDLFGDAVGEATSVSAPAQKPAPLPAAVKSPMAATPPASPPVPPPPPPPPRPSAVVEFADEIVEVRRAPAAAAKATSAAAPAAVANAGPRVLQFSKQASGRGGLLGDDMSQMGGGLRALVLIAALAAGGGILWFVMQCFR